MAEIVQDVRHAARLLTRNPGFAVVAALTLALGIGANTTIFSFVHAVLLKPLPVEDARSLVFVYMTDERNPGDRGVSRQNYVDFRDQSDVFEALTAEGFSFVSLVGGTGEPERVLAGVVAGNYFSTLGVTPILGRAFLPDEDLTEGTRLVTVLGHALWENRFGGDPTIVGRTILLNNHEFTVVGIAPRSFKGTDSVGGPALWVPIMTYPVTTSGQTLQGLASRRYDWFQMTGRLKSGVSLPQAEANVKAVARQLEQAFPNDNAGRSAGVRPLGTLSPRDRRDVFSVVGLLMTVVGLVLFIGCTNVANLMLARAAARQREMAIRQAIGASRFRLVRQLLTEGLLLASIGGGAGLVAALWAQSALWSFRPSNLGANDVDLSLSGGVLAFTALISLSTVVLFALVPALQASRPDLVPELKGMTTHAGAGLRRLVTLRHTLIASQVALSLVALVAAGLFVRSLQTAQQIQPGFDVDRLAIFRFELGTQGYAEAQGREFQRQAIERAALTNEVESAALADLVPLSGGAVTRTVFIEGEDLKDRRNGRIVPTGIVGEGYFKTVGMPVVRGRAFDANDRAGAPLVAVVNESLARQLWPGQDAIGKRVKLFNTEYHDVVGVVGDTPLGQPGSNPPILYRPLTQVYQPNVALILRSGNPDAVLASVRNQTQQLDPRLPITNVSTLSEMLHAALWAPRMAAWLLTVLGCVSLMLAVIGVYGSMAYSVSQRTRELGIRVALGADAAAVIRLVVRQGFRLSVLGIAIGLTVVVAASRLITRLLYGSATDPVILVAVPVILGVAVVAASYLPARRATRVDPLTALRYE
jgi:predicted permease